MELIRQRCAVTIKEYGLDFVWQGMHGAGFSFPCTEDGMPLRAMMQSEALANLDKCLSGEHAVTSMGVRDYSYQYTEPAGGYCDGCGTIVELVDLMTNACDTCGALYDGAGQRLAPASQWEESRNKD